MQRNIVETALGAVVLLVAGSFLFFFYTSAGIKPADGYELTASFSKIDGLETGSEVRVSGIKVGQVTGFKLDPDNWTAIVSLQVNDDVKLPLDTAAVVASAGLLDGKYMTLEPGNEEEMLAPGGRIEYTQSTPGLEQLLGQVIFSLNKGKDGEKGEDAMPRAESPAPAADAAPEMPAAPAPAVEEAQP